MRATVTYDTAQPSWKASDYQDILAPAFRRARRHSRVVRALRVGIPLTIVAGIAISALGSWVLGQAGLSLPALGQLSVSGTKITMDRPRVAGYTRDGRGYEMNAQSAAQDMKTPHIVELSKVHTRMQLRDSGTVVITADAGTYDSKTEMMTLRQNVLGVSADGGEMRLSEVTLDVRKGHVVSTKPVEVVQPRVRINANAMEVEDSGAVVRFHGGVKFYSAGDDAGASRAQLDGANR